MAQTFEYTSRRPNERKRRASSRQYAKHSKAAAAAGVAAAGAGRADMQGQGMAESPNSMTSAATLSTVSTPEGVQVAAGDTMTTAFSNMNPGMNSNMNSDMNVYLGPNDLQDEQFQFDTSAFDLMVQQVRNGQNQDFMMESLSPAEQAAVNSFDFSDYITDCF